MRLDNNKKLTSGSGLGASDSDKILIQWTVYLLNDLDDKTKLFAKIEAVGWNALRLQTTTRTCTKPDSAFFNANFN